MKTPLVERVRRHLERHPGQAFLPSEIARALRVRRVDCVRAACASLRSSREAVSCHVVRRGSAGYQVEEQFRITGGGPVVMG